MDPHHAKSQPLLADSGSFSGAHEDEHWDGLIANGHVKRIVRTLRQPRWQYAIVGYIALLCVFDVLGNVDLLYHSRLTSVAISLTWALGLPWIVAQCLLFAAVHRKEVPLSFSLESQYYLALFVPRLVLDCWVAHYINASVVVRALSATGGVVFYSYMGTVLLLLDRMPLNVPAMWYGMALFGATVLVISVIRQEVRNFQSLNDNNTHRGPNWLTAVSLILDVKLFMFSAARFLGKARHPYVRQHVTSMVPIEHTARLSAEIAVDLS